MILTSSDNALNVVKRSTRKLKDCIQALEVLSESTEDQFLDIGNRLSAFYNGAAKVSELSGTIVGLISGGDIAGTIEGLNALMDGFVVNLKHFDSITSDSISKLNSISDRMEDIEWHLEDMEQNNEDTRWTRVLYPCAKRCLEKTCRGHDGVGRGSKKAFFRYNRKIVPYSKGHERPDRDCPQLTPENRRTQLCPADKGSENP